MRLNLLLESYGNRLQFDYQNELIRTLHTWLPGNDIHDDISLYSLSWLKGGKADNGSICFPGGAGWSISFYDESLVKQLLDSIQEQPQTQFGMRVVNVDLQEAPKMSRKEKFTISSPILAKHFDGAQIRHKTYLDDDVDEILTNTLQRKLRVAGLCEDVKVKFDRSYKSAKTKLVTIKNIKNRASMCPVIVTGNPDSIAFAWKVGIGHSTGCGFGALG